MDELYRKYSPELYRYLYSLTHNEADSEDLLSETFIRALIRLHTFRGDSNVRTWLYSIARNVWLEHLRKNKQHLNLDDLLELYLDDYVASDISAKMLLDCVKEYLSKLNEQTRSVVYHRIEGYSYEEIASKLQISSNSARVIEHRTKRNLKEFLLKEGWIHD